MYLRNFPFEPIKKCIFIYFSTSPKYHVITGKMIVNFELVVDR